MRFFSDTDQLAVINIRKSNKVKGPGSQTNLNIQAYNW